ncbi:hypothetical protein, partial [Streptomyces clavuligerus]
MSTAPPPTPWAASSASRTAGPSPRSPGSRWAARPPRGPARRQRPPAAGHRARGRRTRPVPHRRARHRHHPPQVRRRGLLPHRGGRRTPHPRPVGYRPQWYFRTTDITGVAGNLTDPYGGGPTESVTPGDTVQLTVELVQDTVMETGTRFAVREGGPTVGGGEGGELRGLTPDTTPPRPPRMA